ncbi:HYC_CC_PP family protein [Flavobacterium sp. PLA-1-15]|uniref:HYC_CC_PP family protein n=1 Tax=Flavobacterium sp. PLA-1-15 TaxID=3380533 RepID=UPI003B828875
MRIKKCTSLFLAFLLLVSNFGLAFNVHYCEGKIASISSVFNVEESCDAPKKVADKKCCAEKAKDHKQCCKDKVVDLEDKSSDTIIKTFSFQIDVPFIAENWKPLAFNEIVALKQAQNIVYYCDANAPPLFKLYNQYIFYA